MRNKRVVVITQLLLFLFLLVYFTQISPLQPFDADDWRYIGGMRIPFPIWGAWNPARVLPELLMPLGGYLGAFIIYPLSGNYLWSLTFAEAIIVSAFIVLTVFLFYKLMVKRFKYSKLFAIAAELFFFLSFFLIFKHPTQPSYTAFWTVDLSCDFYYLIPGLLNASLILFILQYSSFIDSFRKFSNIRKGIFILAIYFAIFSNNQLNIILVSAVFMLFLNIIFDKDKWLGSSFIESINNLFKQSWLYLVILCLWLISIVFELNGQRASNRTAMVKGSLKEKIAGIFSQFGQLVGSTNFKFMFVLLILIFIVVIVSIVRSVMQSSKTNSNISLKMIIIGLGCLLISFMYLMLVYLKAGNTYASRPDAMWPVIFFFLFTGILSMIDILQNINNIKVFVPLVLVLEGLIAFNFNYLPKYPINSNHDGTTIYRVNKYMIDQIVRADKEGKSKVIVKVPLEKTEADVPANWPHPFIMGQYLQDTLYSHRMIRSRIHVILKPDKSVSHKLYENKSDQQPLTPIE